MGFAKVIFSREKALSRWKEFRSTTTCRYFLLDHQRLPQSKVPSKQARETDFLPTRLFHASSGQCCASLTNLKSFLFLLLLSANFILCKVVLQFIAWSDDRGPQGQAMTNRSGLIRSKYRRVSSYFIVLVLLQVPIRQGDWFIGLPSTLRLPPCWSSQNWPLLASSHTSPSASASLRSWSSPRYLSCCGPTSFSDLCSWSSFWASYWSYSLNDLQPLLHIFLFRKDSPLTSR